MDGLASIMQQRYGEYLHEREGRSKRQLILLERIIACTNQLVRLADFENGNWHAWNSVVHPKRIRSERRRYGLEMTELDTLDRAAGNSWRGELCGYVRNLVDTRTTPESVDLGLYLLDSETIVILECNGTFRDVPFSQITVEQPCAEDLVCNGVEGIAVFKTEEFSNHLYESCFSCDNVGYFAHPIFPCHQKE